MAAIRATDGETAGEVAQVAERLREIDVVPLDARRSLAVLAPLVNGLPVTDTFVIAPDALQAWRVLRKLDPEIFLIYRGLVRKKCGRELVDILDERLRLGPGNARHDIVLMSPSELRAQPILRDLVEGIYPARGVGSIQGPPGCGKSFLVDHSALSLAADKSPVPGRRHQQTACVIVGAEGRRRGRFEAWSKHHRIDLDFLPIRVIEQALDLRNPGGDIDPFLEQLAGVERDIGKVGAVFIDTLARTFGSGNENAGEDMGAYVANLGRIGEQTGGLVLAVHHTGKDPTKGGRGHSSLLGALDVEITLSETKIGYGVAKVSKLRDGQDGAEFAFQLEAVDLGEHPDPVAAQEGQHWGSCVIVWTDEPPPSRAKRQRIPAGAQVALDALCQALDAHGEQLTETSVLPRGVCGVKVDHWQNSYATSRPISVHISADEAKREQNARRMAFKRAQDQLQAARIVGTGAGFWWIN